MIVRLFREKVAFLFSILLMFFLICACDATTVSLAKSPPTPTPTSTPTTAPTPTPTPIIVPSALPATYSAGWITGTSSNWSGYTFPQSNVTGVRAAWTEPTLSQLSANANVVAWVGIGGWNQSYNNIVQIGTRAYVVGDQVLDYVWYETLPPSHWIMMGAISPGDRVFASVELKRGSSQVWDLSLVDLTSQQSFPVEVSFPSMRVYADFIVEDPDATSHNGPPYFPFPHFTSIKFSKADVRYGGAWTSIGAIPGIQLTLVQSGVVLARPGPLRNDTFTVQRV